MSGRSDSVHALSVEMTDDGRIELEEKRFYVGAVIKSTCPECGAPFEQDCAEQYLSYPPCNKPFDHRLTCSAQLKDGWCDAEWDVELFLEVRAVLRVSTATEPK